MVDVRVREEDVLDAGLDVGRAVQAEAAGVDGHARVDQVRRGILSTALARRRGGRQQNHLHAAFPRLDGKLVRPL